MAESEEELKSLLMKVKGEREKVGSDLEMVQGHGAGAWPQPPLPAIPTPTGCWSGSDGTLQPLNQFTEILTYLSR